MKKLMLIVLILGFGASTYCYGQNVPNSVKMAFNKKFPGAKKVHWGKESANEYEAEFVNSGQKLSANFKTDGKWVETEQDISVKSLPENIHSAVKKDFPNAELKDAAHVWNPKGEVYEIGAEVHEKNMELVYSANGKLISHTQVNESDEADGD